MRSSTLTVGSAGHCVGGLTAGVEPGAGTLPAAVSPQVTEEFGCTDTGPAGSVPVTVSNSDVQVIPTDAASAEDAAELEVPGPRSRGSRETVSPTVRTLPSRA